MGCYKFWLILSCYLLFSWGDVINEKSCGVYNGDFYKRDRIVGGNCSYHGEFPWLLSIQVLMHDVYQHVCGGSIVSPSWLITAAHCAQYKPFLYQIVAGEYNLHADDGTEQKRKVEQIVTKRYSSRTFKNDIALMKLTEPLKFNTFCRPVCIPSPDQHFSVIREVVVCGWGTLHEGDRTIPDKVQRVNLNTIDYKKCRELTLRVYKKLLQKNVEHICTLTEGKDSCQGDSGGPLMCKNNEDNRIYLYGIVSWGIGCAEENNPGIYTKVSSYYDWIDNIISCES